MYPGLTIITAPAAEPLTRLEAKKHLKVDLDDDDALIENEIESARRYVEDQTHRQIVTATWDLVLDKFPSGSDCIYVPRAPLQSITSITYINSAGTSTVWASSNYIVSVSREPGRISLAYGASWPATRGIADAVTIRFVAGYGAYTAVPESVKHPMRLLIGNMYAHRESFVTGTIVAELEPTLGNLLLGLSYGDDFHNYSGAA